MPTAWKSVPFLSNCNRCRKGAHCSNECQTLDWSPNGYGLQHFNWCFKHDNREEDVDWHLVPIPNNGFIGLQAKKVLQAFCKFKILIELVLTDPDYHPGIFSHQSIWRKFIITTLLILLGITNIVGEGQWASLQVNVGIICLPGQSAERDYSS